MLSRQCPLIVASYYVHTYMAPTCYVYTYMAMLTPIWRLYAMLTPIWRLYAMSTPIWRLYAMSTPIWRLYAIWLHMPCSHLYFLQMRGVQVHRNQTLVPTDQEPGGALADAAVVASVAVVTSVAV